MNSWGGGGESPPHLLRGLWECCKLPSGVPSEATEKFAFRSHYEPRNVSCGGKCPVNLGFLGAGLSPPVPPTPATPIRTACRTFDVLVCPLSVTERFLLQPLVCGTVFHHTSLLPPLSIFCCRLKSHLFSLSLSRFLTLLSFVQRPRRDSPFWTLGLIVISFNILAAKWVGGVENVRTFPVAAARLWNSLPSHVRSPLSIFFRKCWIFEFFCGGK